MTPDRPKTAQEQVLGRSWAVLGRSWGRLGRSWGGLGAVLGRSWGDLGTVWAVCAVWAVRAVCVLCWLCGLCWLWGFCGLLLATASVSGSARGVSFGSSCLGCLGRSRLTFDRCSRPRACFVEFVRCSRPSACFVKLIRCSRLWACVGEVKLRFPFSAAQVSGPWGVHFRSRFDTFF